MHHGAVCRPQTRKGGQCPGRNPRPALQRAPDRGCQVSPLRGIPDLPRARPLAAFLGQMPIPTGWKVGGALLLMTSLALALWGSLPRVAEIDVYCPEDIKREREQGTAIKLWCLRLASVFLLLAFAVFFSGLLFF